MTEVLRFVLVLGFVWLIAPRKERATSTREDSPAAGSTDSDSVLLEALDVPYSWGAGTPASRWPQGSAGSKGGVGWDCSGFAQAALVKLGKLLSTATDRTSQGLADHASGISEWEAQEGDLAFYGTAWDKVTHVMVSLGNGQVIGASGGGSATNADDASAKVKIFNTPRYRGDFLGYRRIWS